MRERPPGLGSRGGSSRIGSIAYVGNHGVELLRPGGPRSSSIARSPPGRGASGGSPTTRTATSCAACACAPRTSAPIAAFHWRGAPDEAAAEPAVRAGGRARRGRGPAHALGPQGARGPPARRAWTRARASARLLRDADLDGAPSTWATTRPTSTRSTACASSWQQGRLETAVLRRRGAPTRRRASSSEAADLLVDGTAGRARAARGAAVAAGACASSTSSRRRLIERRCGHRARGVTVLAAGADADSLLVFVAAGWWLLAGAVGHRLGRRARDQPADRAAARRRALHHDAARAAPGPDPAQPAVAPAADRRCSRRPRPSLFPQIPGIATGFAIVWALAWRRQNGAVAAIEDRDGVAFYVEPTSPLSPIKLVRTPGFRRDLTPVATNGHAPG